MRSVVTAPLWHLVYAIYFEAADTLPVERFGKLNAVGATCRRISREIVAQCVE